eukprot:jgi/Astpho2/3396/Aster-04733
MLIGKVDKLVCLGKNYLAHAKELQKAIGDQVPSKPVLFNKPASAAVAVTAQHDTLQVRLPKNRGVINYETEIILRVKGDSFDAVSLGLDLTLRQVLTLLQVFPNSAITGPWILKSDFPGFMDQEFNLKINGKQAQYGKGNEMGMGPDEALAYIREHFDLCEGDIIFTGTPEGVGPLETGDLAEVSWGDELAYSVQF